MVDYWSVSEWAGPRRTNPIISVENFRLALWGGKRGLKVELVTNGQ